MLLIDDYLLPAMMFHWLLSPRTPTQEMLVTLSPVGLIYCSAPILSCPGCASRVRDLARNFYVHSARGGCEGISFYGFVPNLSRLVASTHISTAL